MNEPKLEVIKAGPLSLIQDEGRVAVQHFGISQCGAMDAHAYLWANRLAGNARSKKCAAIEITYGLFSARFSHATKIAIAGADCAVFLNDLPLKNWSSHRVNAGDILAFKGAKKGMRSYLAIAEGFKTPEALGSRAQHPRESWNRTLGNKIAKGQRLPYNKASKKTLTSNNVCATHNSIPDYSAPLTLRVYPAYQFNQFDQDDLLLFTSHEFEISTLSDRMGTRFTGKNIPWNHATITSEPLAFGAIQIPPDGQPIVLLNDRQTLGGYPKIGCVKKDDAFLLAQKSPGDKVTFTFIPLDE